MKRILEVCASSVKSVVAARDGGASRVELCSALEVGGVTPSAGLIAQARKVDGMVLNVLIRPRGGDFLYDEAEVEVMARDIIVARECGADGVVIGALTAEGDVDVRVCRRLMDCAGDMSVTFHRAFDMCRNPYEALEDIISLGCDRILTSGQASTALEGIEVLKSLVQASGGRIIIMPGCGVNSSNAGRILNECGAFEIHASASRMSTSAMKYRHGGVNMGKAGEDEFSIKETSCEEVSAIVGSITKS